MNTASSQVISYFYDSQEFPTTPQSSTSVHKTKKTRQALKTQYFILFKKIYMAEETLFSSETILCNLCSIVSFFIKLAHSIWVFLWCGGAFWLLQLKENYFLNDQIQTWHIKKPTKQGFAYCLNSEYRKLWFWCIMDIFSKKYQQLLNVQNFWEKKIISKFPVDIC